MFRSYAKILSLIFLLSLVTLDKSFSNPITEIQVNGNQRIPDSTILMFSSAVISIRLIIVIVIS